MPSFVDDIDRQIEELQRIKETQLNRATSLNLEAKFKSRAMQQQSSRTNENKNPVVPLDNRKVFVTTEELFPKRGKPASSGPLDYAKRFAAARNHIRDHEAKASTKPKSRGFAMDMQKTHSDIDSSAIYTEESTKIRLDNLTIPESQVSMLLKKYRSLPLSDITKAMIEDDIPGDWISVAILYEKGLRKTSQNGKPFMMLRFTDLKGFRLNAFVFDAVLEASESAEIGSVIAFLNPKIIRPSEVCFLRYFFSLFDNTHNSEMELWGSVLIKSKNGSNLANRWIWAAVLPQMQVAKNVWTCLTSKCFI